MFRSLIFASIAFASTAYSSALFAVTLGSPTDVTFTAAYDGSSQMYMQLLPTDFDPAAQHDVIIALHGSGSDRTQYATQTRDECRATRDAAANHNMIMICPDYRAQTSWMGPAAEADMVQIIASLKAQYNVGKIFITGGSMGGTGSLTFTALHPELIGGVCSVNGLANFAGFQSTNTSLKPEIIASFGGTEDQVPTEYYKRSAANSPQAFTMPFSITAGGADTIVPPTSVLSFYDTVKNSNPKNAKTTSFYRETTGHSTNYVDNAVALEYVIRQARGIDTDLHPISLNTSFEYQTVAAGSKTGGVVDGWTTSDTNVGVTRLTADQQAAKFDSPIPDGNQVALAKNAALYQFTGTTVRAGTYRMSLDVASGKDNAAIGTFLAGFMAADNNIASVSDLAWGSLESYTAGPGLTAGKWTKINLDWTVDSSSDAIGKYLYLNLYATSPTNTVYFDNVGVSFTPVPEPSTIAMSAAVLIGTIVYLWRKRG